MILFLAAPVFIAVNWFSLAVVSGATLWLQYPGLALCDFSCYRVLVPGRSVSSCNAQT